MSADGAIMAEWEWQGSLTLRKLDYRIEYEPENNGNDSCHKFLRGEFILNDETQGRNEDFTWRQANNKFLLDMMTPRIYNYLARLCKADWTQLENPAIKLQQNAKAAQEHINAYDGKYPPPHPDPEVRRIIEMDDDEYDKHLAEIKRQSGY